MSSVSKIRISEVLKGSVEVLGELERFTDLEGGEKKKATRQR